MTVPANAANTVANTQTEAERAALAEFANELAKDLGVSNEKNAAESIVSKIRWYPNKAGAVVIVKRGKDRKVLATISPKSGKWSHLYPSWEPVLAELERQKVANSVSRLPHDGLETGNVPVLAKENQ